MAISAAEVKTLRTRTGAGMMDCKRALADAEGDAERAIELLIRACGFSAIFFVFSIFVFVVGSGAEFIVNRLDIGQFLFSTEDQSEGMNAFVNKRKADWKGQ